MKRKKRMQKAFGVNEFGQIDLPVKISNVRISRIVYGNETGCSRCFPHGYETINSTISNTQRSWKRFRRTRWKPDGNDVEPLASGDLNYAAGCCIIWSAGNETVS
jgi:hypothetical protein